MAAKFHERFDIKVGLAEARRHFVSRLHRLVFDRMLDNILEGERYRIGDDVIIGIGKKLRRHLLLTRQIGDDFEVNPQAVEALFNALYSTSNEYGGHRPYYDHSYMNSGGICCIELLSSTALLIILARRATHAQGNSAYYRTYGRSPTPASAGT
jgi:hypothetical protein